MRRRYILGTALALVLVAVMAIGAIGSGAWFTDSETIENNTIAAGTLDLSVTGGPFTINDLEPSDEWIDLGVIHVENVGTLPLKTQGYLTKTAGTAGFDGVLQVRVELNPEGSTFTKTQYGPNKSELFAGVAFDQLYDHSNTYLDTEVGAVGMPPNSECFYLVQVRLPSTTDNTHQGGSVTADLTVEAMQVEPYNAAKTP